MAPINLHDELWLEIDPTGALSLTCCWAECSPAASIYGQLPAAENNLAFRAVALLQKRARVSLGARLRLVKRIPAAAGLGGGSSDAAAALLAANEAWNLHWPLEKLSAIAAELGSDVPFFLERHPATCRGRGEQVATEPGLGCWHAVVVKPPVEHATAQVYAACRPALQPHSMQACLSALRDGDGRSIRITCMNRLEPAAEVHSPWIGYLRKRFSQLDGICAQMSGSGSSYFGLFRSARQARRAAARLRGSGGTKVFSVRVGVQQPA